MSQQANMSSHPTKYYYLKAKILKKWNQDCKELERGQRGFMCEQEVRRVQLEDQKKAAGSPKHHAQQQAQIPWAQLLPKQFAHVK